MLSQQIDGQKPRAQRQVGLGEQRAAGQRDLPLATIALVHIAMFEMTVAGMAAVLTAKSARPAYLRQRLAALRLAAVTVKKDPQTHAGLKLHLILLHDTSSVSSDGCSVYPRRIMGCDRWGIRRT